MRVLPALLTTFAAASSAWAAPATTAREVCFASGAAGSPLNRCLIIDGGKTSWRGERSRDEQHQRAWASRWFPVGSRHLGWTESGEQRSVRVKAQHFEHELGIPMIEFDQEVALVAGSPIDLRVLPAAEGQVTAQELATLTEHGTRLLEHAIKSCPPEWDADGRFEVRQPKVLGVPGTSGLRAVFLPLNLRAGQSQDDRGAFFFLLNGKGHVTLGLFGHIEWSPGCFDEIARFEPLFFFRLGEDSRTYLLARFDGPWESWGLVALIDPVRARVVSL